MVSPNPLLDIRSMISIQEAVGPGLEFMVEINGNNFSLTVVVVGQHKGEAAIIAVRFGRYLYGTAMVSEFLLFHDRVF